MSEQLIDENEIKLKELQALLKWFHDTHIPRTTATEKDWTDVDTVRGLVYKWLRDKLWQQ